jgi:hypothetical protein
VIGDFLNAEVGRVANHDAVLGCGLKVDRVDAGGAGDDGAQARGDGEVVTVECIETDGAGGGAFEGGMARSEIVNVGEFNLAAGFLDDMNEWPKTVFVRQRHEDDRTVSHGSILPGQRLAEYG